MDRPITLSEYRERLHRLEQAEQEHYCCYLAARQKRMAFMGSHIDLATRKWTSEVGRLLMDHVDAVEQSQDKKD